MVTVMHWSLNILLLWLAVWSVAVTTLVSGQFVVFKPSHDDEELRNIIITDSAIVVGSSRSLYRLGSDLDEEQRRTVETPNRLLVADPSGTFQGNVVECGTLECSLASVRNLSDIRWHVTNGLVSEDTYNVIGVFALGPNGTSALTIGERGYIAESGSAVPSTITKGDLVNYGHNANQRFGKYSFQSERARRERRFLSAFSHENFTYFLSVVEANVNSFIISLFRVCKDDEGKVTTPGDKPLFTSRYEIRLECSFGDSELEDQELYSATFVNSTETFGDPTLLLGIGASTSGSQKNDYMCAYSLNEINELIRVKYETCLDGGTDSDNMVGFLRDGYNRECSVLSPTARAIVRECKLLGVLLPGLEVAAPLSKEAFLSDTLGAGFTSVVYTSLDGFAFVFAGTTNGSLHQYYINSTRGATKVRDISLGLPPTTEEEPSSTHVTRLLASSDGEYIYALTPKKLLRHPVDVCENFTSCDECAASPDPICGWCILERRCTRRAHCSTAVGDQEWVQGSADQCPEIVSSTPSIVYLPQLQELLTTTLHLRNIPPSPAYDCVFDFHTSGNGYTHVATAQLNPQRTMATCSAPSLANIPLPSGGDDAVESLVSLRHMGVDFVTLEGPVLFVDCSVHTSCTSCTSDGDLSATHNCSWCPFSFKCVPPPELGLETCDPLQEDPVSGQCPSIQPMGGAENYLVHVSNNQQLQIQANNLHVFTIEEGSLACQISLTVGLESNILFNIPAVYDSNNGLVSCDRNDFTYSLPQPTVNATLEVLWKDQSIDNPQGTGVTLYSCDMMGDNCAQCLAIPEEYSCAYCVQTSDSGCLLTDHCGSGTVLTDVGDVNMCEEPQITSFTPQAGPAEGGTTVVIHGLNLGAHESDIEYVRIDSIPCSVTDYRPGVRIECITEGGGSTSQPAPSPIAVKLRYLGNETFSIENFSFHTPTVRTPKPASPMYGPLAGGTLITISGTFLDIGSSHRVTVGSGDCIISNITSTSIVCSTPPNDRTESNVFVGVFIDGWDNQKNPAFEYRNNPTFLGIEPTTSFMAGGTDYVIRGTGLNVVQEPRLLMYVVDEGGRTRRQADTPSYDAISEPCTADSSGTEMTCPAPSLDMSSSSPVATSIGLLMDGVAGLLKLNVNVSVYPNPTFKQFEETMEFKEGDPIKLTIQGTGFVFTADQVEIQVTPCAADLCQCEVLNIFQNNNTLVCEVTNVNNLAPELPLAITVHLGNVVVEVGEIQTSADSSDTENDAYLLYLAPAFALVLILAVVIVIVVVAVFCRKTRQKDRRYDLLILELERLESSVARECKLGFAELQTDLDELTGDISGCRLPYHDFHPYLMANLFPGVKDHPVMRSLELPNHRKAPVKRALRDFYETLLLDKKVLITFIHTLEEQRSFTIRDKSLFGSLLMVTLHNQLDYATEILRSLLTELIRRTVAQSYPKLLLRRTESVAERLLTNWLVFCLHGYIVEHAGQPLYLTYRAVKNQLEKGPIDVITGEARYSLSEQKLIRQKMDVEVINATVETDDGRKLLVKLLDCDTISQAKEKTLDAVFKAAAVSERPSLNSIDLEYHRTPMEVVLLRDEDRSTIMDGTWKRINTLRHYGVRDGAILCVVPRKEHAPPGRTWDYPASLISTHCSRQRALSEAEDGTRVWHLFKQLDVEDPRTSPLVNKKMVAEIYLPRMLSTKSILQKFVDDLFSSLFSVSHPPSSPTTIYSASIPQSPGVQVPMGYAPGTDAVPLAVKYLFDFLDDEARNAHIEDPDVVHTWKNNALSLRFWVNMIKNPEFVFDINKSHTVDACLSVIAQAFIDGCSSAEAKLNIDSPTSKLLYNKEVQGYKAQVRQYYADIATLPRVPGDAMSYYLKQLSSYHSQLLKKSGGFVVESALYELLRYGVKYHEPFLDKLRSAGLETKAQTFEGVLQVVMN